MQDDAVDLVDLVAYAGVVVSLGSMGVAIMAADFSRRQAAAAEKQAHEARDQTAVAQEQAEAARDAANAARAQAEVAKVQAEAAWEQVAEARRANELAEAERSARRAVEAVQWRAINNHTMTLIEVRNVGTETAYNVRASRQGTDEDWQHGAAEASAEEVRAGDYFPFRLRRPAQPRQIYVDWDGSPHPRAVVVEQGGVVL